MLKKVDDVLFEINEIKQTKSRSKAVFTRDRNCLVRLLEEDLPSRRKVRELLEKMNEKYGKYLEDLTNLSDYYSKIGDRKKANSIMDELEEAEEAFTSAHRDVEQYLEQRREDAPSWCLTGRQNAPTQSRVKMNG